MDFSVFCVLQFVLWLPGFVNVFMIGTAVFINRFCHKLFQFLMHFCRMFVRLEQILFPAHMFEQLKKKWNVGAFQLFLILCVFAITGTATAYLTRMVTRWFNLESSSVWYWIAKAGVLIIGYQIMILLVSIPFGQFRFFWNFEKRLWGRLTGKKKPGPLSNKTNY